MSDKVGSVKLKSRGMKMKKLLMVLILIPMVALATTYYVDASSGLDSNSGKSAAAAKKTIQAAIDASSSGDTILVAAGTYDPINAVGKVLTIRSVGGASVTVIDGKGTKRCAFLSDEEGSFGPPTESSGAFDSVLDGFTLKNGYHNNSGEANNSGAGVSGGTVENCVIINCRARSGAGASNSKLHRCEIRDNVAGDDGGGLVGCIADNSLLCRNKAHNEGGGRAGSAASCSQLYNCTVTENVATGKDGYVAAIDYYMTVRNCIVWGNTDTSGNAADVIYTVVDTCCTSNPKFVDVANGNYRLALDSPCIDTGDNTYVVGSSDLDGNARIVNGRVDIGCYEFGSSEALENGLVAWYKFDGNANDSSGNGNDGTAHGVTLTTDRNGNPNSAYSFDGDDWISVAHDDSLNPDALTVSVWMKPSDWYNGHIPIICKSNESWREGSYRSQIDNHGDTVTFMLRGSASADSCIEFGKWQLITITVDGQCMCVYRNGLLLAKDDTPDGVQKKSDDIGIGRNIVGATEYFKGVMDDFRIYNRALSATEVKLLYEGDGAPVAMKCAVTFDAAGGTAEWTKGEVAKGAALGTLPTATREGYSFDGWYTAASGGTKVSSSTTVTADVTLYAQWTQNVTYYTVTFNANGGSCSTSSKQYASGSTLGTLQTATREGYSFDGWYTAVVDGTKVTASTMVTGNVTYYAHWLQNVTYYTVTFNANGGSCSTSSKQYSSGSTLGTLPTATREGYSFDGWYTVAVGGTKLSDSTPVTADMTLYAQWTKIEPMSCAIGGTGVSAGSAGLFSEGGCTMWVKEGDDWSADGGVLSSPLATYDWETMEQTLLAMRFGSRGILSFEYRIEDESGRETLASFSEAYAPESEYEWWEGPVLWFMDEGRIGGWQTAQIEVLSTGWDYHLRVQGGFEDGRRVRFRNFKWHSIPAKVTFTLDPSGGTVSPSTITLSTSGTFGNSLPRPSRKDCTFLGWRRGASPVSSTMPVFLSDSTLYADWSIPLRNALDPSGTLKSALFADDWSSWAGVDESGNPDSGLFCMYIEGSGRTALLTVTVEGAGKLKWNRLGIEDSQSVRLIVDGSEYRAFKNWSVFGGDAADVELSFDRTGTHTIKLEAEAGKIAMIESGPMLWTGTAPTVAVFSVSFDAMGGDCVERARDVESGKSVGTLPTPVRSKYKFLGWYTQPEGGTKISASTKVTASVTYYAHWQYDGSVYVRVSVAEDCEGMGTVSGGNKSVKGGSSVTLTAKPAKGYVFSQWRPVGVTEDGWEDFWNAYEIYNPSLKIKAGSEDVAFEASFVPVDSSRLCVPGFDEWHDNVGVALREGLTVWDADRFVSIEGESASLVKFTVSGVPSGVKYKVHNQVLVFYGTPSREGIYWVTYTIKNAGGYQATSVLKWIIGNPKQTDYDNIGLDMQSDDWKRISNLYVGEALSDALCLDNWVGARHGETITKWTISGLPSGLKLQQNCRGRYVITGMPTKAGKYTLTITATYADKHTAKAAQTIVVTTDPYGSGYVLVAVDPECGHMGSASGGGVCAKAAKAKLSAKANKGYVFAGWYDGGGDRWMNTDSGDWRKASDSYVLRAGDGWPEFYARFVPQANDRAVTIRCPSEWIVECLNVGNLLYDVCSFDVESASLPTVTVSGLPSGCKFDKVNMRLVFEKQPPKPGISKVTIKAKNVSGATDEKVLYVKVPNLRSDVFDGIDYDRDYKVPQYDSMVVCQACWASFSARPGWTVTASGLPSGLKLVKDSYGSYMVVGTATKAGAFTVTLTAKNGGVSEKATFTMIVDPLPSFAIGTFNGKLFDEFVELDDDAFAGTFTMTSTASGKLTATLVMLDGTKHTYSANAWGCIDNEDGSVFVRFTKKVKGDCWHGGTGEEQVDVTIRRACAWDDYQLTGKFTVNPCKAGGQGTIRAQRNPFGKIGKAYENSEAHSVAATLSGFGKMGVFAVEAGYGEYNLECPGCIHMPYGTKQDLTFTVTAAGVVKVAGKIAGKSVSGSSALRIIDGDPQADFVLSVSKTPIRINVKFCPNCGHADVAVYGTVKVGW